MALQVRLSLEQDAVQINPIIWKQYEHVSKVLPDPATSYSRNNLEQLVTGAFRDNNPQLISELFVKTMMWGSGTTNGRGPRYTNKALSDGKLVGTLIKARELLMKSDIPAAFDLHRQIPGVGPSFHTKLLWVIGSDIENLNPRPLILDELVWKGLKLIGWSSIQAAGTLNRGRRYGAYLDQCSLLATQHSCSPEDIEYSLFLMGKNS
jgi:hypothetical protein